MIKFNLSIIYSSSHKNLTISQLDLLAWLFDPIFSLRFIPLQTTVAARDSFRAIVVIDFDYSYDFIQSAIAENFIRGKSSEMIAP